MSGAARLRQKSKKIPGADSAGNKCHSVRLKTGSIEIELLLGHGVQYLTWVNVNTGNEYFILPPDEAGSSERMQDIIIFLVIYDVLLLLPLLGVV